jgi:hypothetical protein
MNTKIIPAGADTPPTQVRKENSDMAGSPSTSPVPTRGKITRIAVTYTVNTDQGPRHTFHGLIGMQRYVRPERLQELTDDLTVICEELLANRPQPAAGLPEAVARLPFAPPPASTDHAKPGQVAACWDLLAVVAGALDCPPPADQDGEEMFLRLRSDRARLVLAALRPVLANAECGPEQMSTAAARLRDGLAACPADGYAVSPLSS